MEYWKAGVMGDCKTGMMEQWDRGENQGSRKND